MPVIASVRVEDSGSWVKIEFGCSEPVYLETHPVVIFLRPERTVETEIVSKWENPHTWLSDPQNEDGHERKKSSGSLQSWLPY